MRATSNEMRELIVDAKQRGEKTKTIITWFKVSKSTVDKIWSRYRNTGSSHSKAQPGRKPIITSSTEEKIREKIKEENDITLEELIEELNLPIKKSRLSELLIEWGISFKKNSSRKGTTT